MRLQDRVSLDFRPEAPTQQLHTHGIIVGPISTIPKTPGAFSVTSPAHASIAPMLSVRRGSTAIEFYKAAFGAEELFRIGEEGKGVVAQMSVAGAEFWLADESPEYQNFSPESLGGSTVRMVLVVANPDAVFKRALAAGAKAVSPVEDKEYGWRVGRVVDPYGHHWEIGKPLS
jgi:PhnB protein